MIGLIIGLLISICISAALLHVAAKTCSIAGADFSKAFTASAIIMVANKVLTFVLNAIPLIGSLAVFPVTFFVSLLTMKKIYNISWMTALIMSVVQFVIVVLLGMLSAMLIPILL